MAHSTIMAIASSVMANNGGRGRMVIVYSSNRLVQIIALVGESIGCHRLRGSSRVVSEAGSVTKAVL